MFVQLRRVVYLLVLLQCCACVAYAQGAEFIGNDGAIDVSKVEEKLKSMGYTMEGAIINGTAALYIYDEGVAACQRVYEFAESVEEEMKDVAHWYSIVETSSLNQPTKYPEVTKVLMNVKTMFYNTIPTVEMTNSAALFCKSLRTLLDGVVTQDDGLIAPHVKFTPQDPKPSSEVPTSGSIAEPVPTPLTAYGELFLLRKQLNVEARNDFKCLADIKEKVEDVKKALKNDFRMGTDPFLNEIEAIEGVMKGRNYSQLFLGTVQNVAGEIQAERLRKAREKEEERGKAEQEGTESSTVTQAGEGSPTTEVKSSALQTQQTENTTSTTAAAPNDGKKDNSRDAANAPMSHTAVVAVLALTVSTVVGIAVV